MAFIIWRNDSIRCTVDAASPGSAASYLATGAVTRRTVQVTAPG